MASSQLMDSEENEIYCDNDKLNNYELKRLVGSGEFCDVYKAKKLDTGQVVALKRLRMRQMFHGSNRISCLREIRVLRKLDHPNIIRHIESFIANNELFIALEYADSGDLSKMLDYFRKNNVTVKEKIIWNIFSQVSAGLEYMHSQRVMHRDIKPANVLINRDRTVKLADFGLSLLLSATTDNARSLVGTPYYMAPERLSEQDYCFKADIWSLACLLYELTSLQPPFFEPNQNIQNLIEKIQNLNYLPIKEGYSSEIQYIISQCLVMKPEHRMDIRQVHFIARTMHLKMEQQNDPSNQWRMELESSASQAMLAPTTSIFHQPPNVSEHVFPGVTSDPHQSPQSMVMNNYSSTGHHSTTQANAFKKFYKGIRNMF